MTEVSPDSAQAPARMKVISAQAARPKGSVRDVMAYLKWVWARRDLVTAIAHSELKQTVIGSRLSYLWWLMEPLFALVCYIFLVLVLSRGRGLPIPFPLWILTAIMPWTWMTGCTMGAVRMWNQYQSTITQIRFPYLVLIFSRFLHELVLYLISYVILFGTCIAYGYLPRAAWALLPAVIAAHGLLVLALMLFASVVSWYFADLDRVLPFVLRLWFFSSPALYSITMLDKFPVAQRLMHFNPMYHVFACYRGCFFSGVEGFTFPQWWELAIYLCATGACVLAGLALFIRKEPYITRHI